MIGVHAMRLNSCMASWPVIHNALPSHVALRNAKLQGIFTARLIAYWTRMHAQIMCHAVSLTGPASTVLHAASHPATRAGLEALFAQLRGSFKQGKLNLHAQALQRTNAIIQQWCKTACVYQHLLLDCYQGGPLPRRTPNNV
jgi:hypothetical protein